MTKLFLVLLVCAAIAAPAALAADLPTEGDFKVTGSWIANTPMMISMGGKQPAGVGDAVGTATNDAGQGFLHSVSSHCVYQWGLASGSRATGACVKVDLDGDAIYSTWANVAPAGEPGHGPETFAGGTGKYAGLTGTGEWAFTEFKPTEKNGNDIGMYHEQGHYRLSTVTQ